MSSVESYDGLCGVIYHYSTSDRQIRCKYDFNHGGPHSWVNDQRVIGHIFGGITLDEVIQRGYLQPDGSFWPKK